MKEKKFEIKISDLLHQLASDTLTFEDIFLDDLPNLIGTWISGTVELYSMDGESVFAKLTDVHAVMKATCDVCLQEYERTVDVDEYTAKFALNKEDFEESDEEVVFMIDPKNETIDLGEMIYQAIVLQDPFVFKCPSCETKEVVSDDYDSLD